MPATDMDALRRKRFESASFPFRDRDVALYNLSIGASNAWQPVRARYRRRKASALRPHQKLVGCMQSVRRQL
jgi:hypothetical protein